MQLGAIKGGGMVSVVHKALSSMLKLARPEEISDKRVLCRLYDTLVAPILWCGCKV